MNENKIREDFRSVILEKVEEAFEIILDESSVPENLVPYEVITFQVADEQTDLSFADFMDKADDVSENEINDQVRGYVNEEFDSNFFVVKIEEKIDYDQIQEELREELILLLRNTEPYSGIPREYWYNQARRVQSTEELASYSKMDADGLEMFTEKYAPDWEEIAKENQD